MQQTSAKAHMIWSEITDSLREEVSDIVYKNYLRPTFGVDVVNNTHLLVSVPHEIAKTRFEQQYLPMIKELIKKLAPDIEHIVFSARNDETESIAGEPNFFKVTNLNPKQNLPVEKNQPKILLNPNYTFDRFVVGNSNRFAFSAASAVGEKPGFAYNPLFLYSPVGLGKTHLMHAIGHKILSDHPNLKVLYISSETFVNELVESIQNRKTDAFRNKYRSIDVLLIDDVQFLQNKPQTQEEFFHTFNALRELNKQIVVSSDRPPKEISLLEERIRSRFESGLVADISTPDLETRIAILRNKASRETIQIPHEVIVYIADNISNNIRELEGALTRVLAVASMSGAELTLSVAESALKDIIKKPKQKMITMNSIKAAVCEYFKVKITDLESNKRPRNIAFPRQIAMYLCREMTNESLPSIGTCFNRDHSTVIHAYDKICNEINIDSSLRENIKRLAEKIIEG
ncbi:MAG: chromosomal replication initiator protein DnaA [Negativicutes bacterium]|jgi:chromosomal replication initiator protein